VNDARDRHAQAVATAGGALIGLTMGSGPLGVVAGAALGPLLEPFAARVLDELGSTAKGRAGRMLAVAQMAVGGDRAEMERLVLASDESLLQAGIAVQAAARTTWEPKVVAIGRALAAGLLSADDARIDPQPLIMAALADIEMPHASLLELLVCRWPLTKGGEIVADPLPPRDPEVSWRLGLRVWEVAEITEARPSLRPVLPGLLGTLQRHGLAARGENPADPMGRTAKSMQQRFVADRLMWGVPGLPSDGEYHGSDAWAIDLQASTLTWQPTELGEEVLNELLAAGAEFID
jgi:hypothetical protein